MHVYEQNNIQKLWDKVKVMYNKLDYYDIKDAIDDIGKRITRDDSLMIVIITHGGPGGFGIRADVSDSEAEQNPESQDYSLDYSDFGNYLNETFGNTSGNRKYAVMITIIQACNSGTAIKYLYGDHRILITATRGDEEAWTEAGGYDHWAFLYQSGIWPDIHPGFILSMGTMNNPHTIFYAFKKGSFAAQNNSVHNSHPQIDDNFNGLSAQDGDTNDGEYANKIYL